uniref:histone H2A-like n=1 Tax=Myxine glutinosa TaxID=7769 RepID=UPI00358FF234
MSGRGKGGKGLGKGGAKRHRKFPVSRVHRHLRKGNYAKRIGAGLPVLPSTWRLCSSTWLQRSWSSQVTLHEIRRNHGSSRVICSSPSAFRNDEEMNKLLCRVTISQGGVLPNIHAVLLPKKTQGT